jgi:type IV secretion system T-DNA border endonuclease VirD2
MARTADAMRSLSHVAALTGLPEIGEKIAKAEEALRRGGVLQPFPGDVATAERADLDRHFSGWMAEAERKIRKMPVAERKEMRDELYGYAIDIAKGWAMREARNFCRCCRRPNSMERDLRVTA